MSLNTRKKKPTGRAAVHDLEEESQTFREQSEPLLTTEGTPLRDTDPLPEIEASTRTNLQPQMEQTIRDTLGVPVQLSDDQFRQLFERLAPADLAPGLTRNAKQRAAGSSPDNSPSDNPSDHDSDRDLDRPRRQTPGDRLRNYTPEDRRRSPKHNDPGQLDDGTSPTYNAWCILLEGKLEANADWWPTERARINYVFSQTTGKAQEHLEPRMSRKSPDRWSSVEEILDHLDVVFRNYFQKEQASDQYAQMTQQPSEDFNDFHSEFARLASLGEIPPSIWRADLYRKLNRTFQDRLLATEHLYPVYSELVRACQRINVRLLEHRRRFPRQESTHSQRYRSSTTRPAVTREATPRPLRGLLPAPRYPTAAFRALPSSDKRDSATPGPRDSPTRDADPTKATCFNCGEEGHFANSCPTPRKTPRIHEIEQDTEVSGDDERTDEDDTDESEN
jgi:hypothetical protein